MRQLLYATGALDPNGNVRSFAYGVRNTAEKFAGIGFGVERDVFGQLLGPLPDTLGRSQTFQGYAIWDTNPYLAWTAAWHDWSGSTAAVTPSSQHSKLAATWITSKFQALGMWHGEGWLRRVPSTPDISGNPKLATVKALQLYRARMVSNNTLRVCSLDEVLDCNMGGCHTNAATAISLLRSQGIPATLSHDNFWGFGSSSAQDAVGGTSGEGRFVDDDSISSDFDGYIAAGHASIVLGFHHDEMLLQHSDRMLADRLGVFQDPAKVWLPYEEHLLVLFGLDSTPAFQTQVKYCVAGHEQSRTSGALANASSSWTTRRAQAIAFDTARIMNVSPYATERAGWFYSMERTLLTSVVRILTNGPLLSQAKSLLLDIAAWDQAPEQSLEAETAAQLRRLVAIFLGIDSYYIWGDVRESAPTSLGPQGPGPYLSAAPFLANFRLTGFTGLTCYNYRLHGVGVSDNWQNVRAGARLLRSILNAPSPANPPKVK